MKREIQEYRLPVLQTNMVQLCGRGLEAAVLRVLRACLAGWTLPTVMEGQFCFFLYFEVILSPKSKKSKA